MERLTKDRARQIANLICIPLGIALNFVPGIGGSSVGAITRRHESLLAAAGWTFSIWSVIFLGQLSYAIYQALPSQRENPTLRRIGWMTALNGLLEGAWTLAFCKEALVGSWVIMFALLVNLVAIDVRLRSGGALLRATYALNLGWISVAMILDTSLVLWDVVGWHGAPLSPAAWCAIMVCIAAVLACAMIARGSEAFAVAVAWGLVGIGAYRLVDTRSLAVLCFVLAGALVALALVSKISRRIVR